MNETETTPPDASRGADLTEKCQELQRVVNMLFAGLIITSFTLTAFLGLQAHRSSVELQLTKPRADQAASLLRQDNLSAEGIYTRLVDFGRTHPDFQNKILSKYKAGTNTAAAKP